MNGASDTLSLATRWQRRLFAPVDITFLIWFRILLGAMLVWEVSLFFWYGFIDRYFVEPMFHLTYYGFGWVTPLPGTGMHVLFGLLGLAGLFLTIGLYARLSAALFCVGFAYVFLLEQTRYLNHFYLIILLCGLIACMPIGGAWSVDSLLRPGVRRATAPAWTLWLLRFQLSIVYFFAGLAKLHPDWLSGRVISEMMAYKQHLPLVADFGHERWFHLSMSYAALFFDLLVAPLLLWRRTRLAAVVVAVAFHASNSVMFQIDVFPWLMIGATIILFVDDRLPWRVGQTTPAIASAGPASSASKRRTVVGLLAVYVTLQLLIPLRHLAYPGDAAWTEEGHQFAWRMLMRVKTGQVPRFPVRYVKEGKQYQSTIPVPPDPAFWSGHWQARKIVQNPDAILQIVQQYADELRRQEAEYIDIRAIVPVSLNGHPPQLLIDPNVNLAEERRSLGHKPWVTLDNHPSR